MSKKTNVALLDLPEGGAVATVKYWRMKANNLPLALVPNDG